MALGTTSRITMTLAGSEGTSFDDMLCCKWERSLEIARKSVSRQQAAITRDKRLGWCEYTTSGRTLAMTQCSRCIRRSYVIKG
jgi:hypothetical protein